MKTIPEDTPLIPEIIAEQVVSEIRHLNPPAEAAASLAARAEDHYNRDKGFTRKVRSARGREWLYSFMRHWLAGDMVRAGCPRENLPPGFANGQEPQLLKP
jgi:hypothetical protein